MENVVTEVRTSEICTHLTVGKGNKTASEMFLNEVSFKPKGVHFPDFFFFIFFNRENDLLLAGCLQGTIYSNGKRLHFELKSAQH